VRTGGRDLMSGFLLDNPLEIQPNHSASFRIEALWMEARGTRICTIGAGSTLSCRGRRSKRG
jgi:hypothetical protein